MKKISQVICLSGLMFIANSAMGQSYKDHMEVQKAIQDLNWQIQIREKQLAVEKLDFDIEEIKMQTPEEKNSRSQSDSNQQVFSYGGDGSNNEQHPPTEAELAEMERRIREAEDASERDQRQRFINGVSLIEVFEGPESEDLQAIVSTRNGAKEIQVGSSVGGWQVSGMTMQSVAFVHPELDLEREIRHIR